MPLDLRSNKYPPAREWVVTRFRRDRRRVMIWHTDGSALPAWIAKLLRHLPSLQPRSLSNLLEEVRNTGAINLGVMAGREAHHVQQTLAPQKFDVRIEDASYTTHFPTHAGNGLIIEAEAEAEAFCLQLIREGAAVREIED